MLPIPMRPPRAGAALLLCLLPLLVPLDAAAQIHLDSWTIADGLPQNSVNDIAQTPDGYLWLATFGGLVRFDGVRFVVFDRATAGVGSIRIRVLHVDRTGALWAATDDGMLIRYRDGVFTTFDRHDGLAGGVAMRLDEDPDGNIWITWKDTVTQFDGETFTNYLPGDLPHDVRPHGEPASYADQGSLWWSTEADGLHCLIDGRVDLCLAAADLQGSRVVHVSTDRAHAVWVHTAGGSVIRVVNGRARRYTQQDGLPRADGHGWFFKDPGGPLWFMDHGDLRRIEAGRSTVVLTRGLTMYRGREGSMWFGAATGLYRLRTDAVASYSLNGRLSSRDVYAVLRDRRGDLWIGTWGGGLDRISRGRVSTYRATDGLPSDQVTAVFETADGRLLVGTDAGLASLSGNRIAPYPDPNHWLGGNVWAIDEDHAGGLWFGTDHGLVRQTGGRSVRYTSSDGLSDDHVTALLRDRDGVLWIGTSRGLSVLRDGAFATYTERDGLVGNHVRALFQDEDGVMWIGTYDGGLYRLDASRLTRYTTKDGLHDNGVFQILEDSRHNFWMDSNRGISRVARTELDDFALGRIRSVRATVFGVEDGLPTLECNGGRQPGGLQAPDGRLWFPTQDGLAIVDPAAVASNPHPPPVTIESVRLRGQAVDFRHGLDVPPDRNTVEIRYTAMSFIRPEQVRFRYRLAGLDDRWVDAGSRRSVTYYRIPPGRYHFEVAAANSDGVWSASNAVMDVVVLAPLWRRGWFIGLLAAAGGALLVGVERRHIRRLRTERARQEAYARQLVTAQEHERRRISNELHDSLGQDLFMIKTRARTTRHEVGAGTRLGESLQAIGALVDHAYDDMKTIAYALRPYQLDKIGLSKTIAGMLDRVTETCGITFETDIADIDALVNAESTIGVYRIVQEAVNNVVRHSGARSARVRIAAGPHAVEIRIEDDGKGFDPPATAPQATERGFGLTSMRERARGLGGSLTVRSRPGHGTSVCISLPIPEGRDG